MSITSHSEDILPEISYHSAVVAQPRYAVASTALLRDISGCLSILGPIQVCYDVNFSIPSAAISLKVGGVTIVSGEISPEHPCLVFQGNYGIAKWDLNICLRIPEKKITLEGAACVTILGCRSFNITLFHWGDELIADFRSTPTEAATTNVRNVGVYSDANQNVTYLTIPLPK